NTQQHIRSHFGSCLPRARARGRLGTMARDVAPCGDSRPDASGGPGWPSSGKRWESRKAAAAAAEAAVHRLSLEARAWHRLYEDLAAALGATGADGELGRRLAAAAPALAALIRGEVPSAVERLRRNVAVHSEAEGIDLLDAGAAQLRVAQHGPRLGAKPAAPEAGAFGGALGERLDEEPDEDVCALLAGAGAAGPLPELPAGALHAVDLEKALSEPQWAPGMWAKAHAETVSFVSGLAAGWHLAEREPLLPPGARCTCGAVVFSAPPVASEVPLAAWQTECALAPPPRPALLECRSGSQVGRVAAAAAASDDLLLGALGIVGYDGERECGCDGDDRGAFVDHAVPAAGVSSPLLLSVGGRLGEAVSHNDGDDDSVGGQGQEHADCDAATACSATAESALRRVIADYLGENEAALLRGDGDGGRAAARLAELALPTEDAEGEVRRDWGRERMFSEFCLLHLLCTLCICNAVELGVQ
ncbi:unnamed protein product, partial [Prorocentrum cordatum]